MRTHIFTVISIPVFGALYILTFFAALATFLAASLHLRNVMHGTIRFWANAVFWITGKKLHFSGRENIEQNKNYILVANHSSLFDIMAIMSVFPGISWFGRERLLKIPLFGCVLKMIDYVPMKTADIKNTRHMINQLIDKADGFTIAIFPEGTRTIDGNLGRFRKGFIHLLRAGNMDVLPVTLNGFYNFKPKTRFTINFKAPLEVCIHKPVSNAELVVLPDKEILSRVRDVIESVYHN